MSWLQLATHLLRAVQPARRVAWPDASEHLTEGALRRAWPRSEPAWSQGRLQAALRRVHDGAWQPGALRHRRRRKPNGGWRDLGIPPAIDRAIQRVLLDATETLWSARLDPRVLGYRPGASTWAAVTRLTQEAQSIREPHLLQLDVADLFGTVPHAALEPVLRLWPDPIWRTLYPRWLMLWTPTPGRGVPQGAPLSPLFANLALATLLDPALRGQPWIRWGDDVALVSPSATQSERVHRRVAEALKPAGMTLAHHKTRSYTPEALARVPASVLGHKLRAVPQGRGWALQAERGRWDRGG